MDLHSLCLHDTIEKPIYFEHTYTTKKIEKKPFFLHEIYSTSIYVRNKNKY